MLQLSLNSGTAMWDVSILTYVLQVRSNTSPIFKKIDLSVSLSVENCSLFYIVFDRKSNFPFSLDKARLAFPSLLFSHFDTLLLQHQDLPDLLSCSMDLH